MVNDKMVNGFMEKKLYSTPLFEVMNLGSELMQHLNSVSTTVFPGGPGGAPDRHRTPVF